MKRRLLALAVVVAVALGRPPSAHAGNDAEPPVAVDLDAITRTLDEVVVLAAKRPQPLREAPASTSVITAADLEAYGWRDFTEAIASLAGFYTTDPRDSTYLGVRGISLKGDTNGRILILVDGHVQQELWSHAAYPELMGLDATLIDHIEVLRGPASALWGSLGFLGVINVVTRRASESSWGRASFDLTDVNGFRGAAYLGHRFKNELSFGLAISAGYDRGHSYTYPELADDANCSPDIPYTCKHGVSDMATDGSAGVSIYGNLEWKGLSLKVSYQWLDKHIPFAPYRTLFNDQANHYVLQRGYVDLGYVVGRASLVQAQLRAYFDSAGYADDLAYSDTGMLADRYLFHDEARPWWAGSEVKLYHEHDFADRLHLAVTVGGEYTYFHGDDRSGVPGMPGVSIARDLMFGAAYAQAEASYARKLFLTLGVRGDFSDFFPDAVSPRAGLVLLPYKSGTFKLLYAHGFIHPAWYDAFFNDNVSILNNPGLKPERADNYELVWQEELAESLLLTTSVFYIHGDDLIAEAKVCVPDSTVVAPSPDCPAGMSARQQQQNISSFQSVGAEAGLVGKLKRNVRLYANYSYAHARRGDGTRPIDSPEHLAKLGASVPVWRDRLVLAAEARVISQRRFADGDPAQSDPVVLLSAMVMWRGLPPGLTASLKGYFSATGTWYEPSVAEDSYPVTRIPHPAASFVLRLTYAR